MGSLIASSCPDRLNRNATIETAVLIAELKECRLASPGRHLLLQTAGRQWLLASGEADERTGDPIDTVADGTTYSLSH